MQKMIELIHKFDNCPFMSYIRNELKKRGFNMKIILLEDVKNIGKKGDLAEANDGYARNYLLPKKLAVKADKTAIIQYKQRKEKEERQLQAQKQKALDLKD